MGLLFVLVTVVAVSAKSSATLGANLTDSPSRGPHRTTAHLQQHAGHAPGTPAPPLSVAVDGSVSPELIPDELAYSHFLRAMAASATGRGRGVALTQAGLAPGDRAAFVAALGTLGTELAALAEQRRAGGPSLSPAAWQELKSREDEAVAAARVRVDLALTAAGRARLDAHIRDHVKRRIKLYRAPMPAPAPGGALQ
jgi:hypothetical protein